MAKSKSETDAKERGKSSISLENFGQRRGQVRALEEFRNRKLRKRVETAKALRKYKKVMKEEGFDAGQGAGRRRSRSLELSHELGDDHDEADRDKDKEDRSIEHQKKRKPKTNPFQKSLEKATHKRQTTQNKKLDHETNEKERRKRLFERKVQSKLLAKRTKRGQPIMKHTVDNMLAKLQRQDR